MTQQVDPRIPPPGSGREPIGLRAARYRDIGGKTQRQVADALSAYLGRSISEAYVSMIENGKRRVTKRDLLIALAHAVDVSVVDLLGQPYPATARVDLAAYSVVPAVRAALDGPEDPVEPRPIEQLAFASDQAMAARMACDLAGIGVHLPDLLADTRTLFFDRGDARAGKLLVQAAVTGSLALKPAGWVDLAVRLAELADTVAGQLGDPVSTAAAKFALAQCALANGSRRRSYQLALDGMGVLDGQPAPSGRIMHDTLAWLTMLHLHAGLSAASMHRGDDADSHLHAARNAAGRVQGDPWRMEATRANVDTWEIAFALENGEPGRAPDLARRVDVSALHTRQRRARLHLDTGRALHLVGREEDAVRELLAADDAAPGDLRQRPSAVEIVWEMLQAVPARNGSDALLELARRCGVDPLTPPMPV